MATHANPDGMELVSGWYMRKPNEKARSTGQLPRLYQKYVGHDNNRDFYMMNQPESTNMNRILYREWFPQITYNHHQTGPTGTVMFAPPFRDPFNDIYLAGRNSINRGNTDHWTIYPRRIAEVKDAIAKDLKVDGSSDSRMVPGGRIATVPEKYYAIVRKPEYRDPRGFILSANEGDFLTATKFVNIMIKTGLTAHRATAPFTVAGKQYPAGSYVFKGAQAFRPHLLDMFEPQDHPNDFQYPGGPPIPPYDSAGWTLAFQMGLKFDRVLDTFDGPFDKIPDVIKPAPGRVTDTAGAVGYVVNHRNNDAFIAINRLMKANEEAFFVGDRGYQSTDGTGVIFITAKPTTSAVLTKAAADLGLTFTAVTQRPAGAIYKLTKPRIGLWDQYGGSMPSGHLRWLLEQFEFDFERVFPATLDAGNLKAKFDVILFPDGGIPETDNAGGVLVAFGGSAVLGHHLGLPVSDHLVEVAQDGTERPLPETKYYIPGSVLSVAVDNTPVMELAPNSSLLGVKPVAWFDTKNALRSGWAWGQHYLEGGTAAVEAQLGKGKVFLFGPEITFRAQPHGTFKFLFNSIYYGTSVPSGAAAGTTMQ